MLLFVNINNTFAFYALDVQPVMTVAEVQAKLERKTGLTVDNQRCLHHHGRMLPHWSLLQAGIRRDGAVLTVFLHKPAGLLPFVNAVCNGIRMRGSVVRSPLRPLIELYPPPDPRRLTVSNTSTGAAGAGAGATRPGTAGTAGVEPLMAAYPGRFEPHACDGALDGRGWRDALEAERERVEAEALEAEAARRARARGLMPGTEAFAKAMAQLGATGASVGDGSAAGGAGSPAPPQQSRAQRIAARNRALRAEKEAAEAAARAEAAAERAARRAAGEDVSSSDEDSEDDHASSITSFYAFSKRRLEGFDVSNQSKSGGGATAVLGVGAWARHATMPVGPNTITATQRLGCYQPFVLKYDMRTLRRMTDDPKVFWDLKVRLWGGPKDVADVCVDASCTVGWESKKGVVLLDASDDSGNLATQRSVIEADKQRESYPHLYNEPEDDPMTHPEAYPRASKRRAGKFTKAKRRVMRRRNWRLTIDAQYTTLEYFHRQLKQWYPGARYNVQVYGMARPRYGEITLKTGFFVFHAGRMHFVPPGPGTRPVGTFRGPPPVPRRRKSRPSGRVSRARVYQRRMTQENQAGAAAAAAVAAEAGKDAEVADGDGAAGQRQVFEMDDGGALYWIGQQVARRTYSDKDFANPGVAGAVRVARSSGTAGSIHDVVDPSLKTSVYTGNVPYSFYTLDLQAYSIVPSHYALRHGYNSAAYALRSWQLTATNDPPVDELALLPGEKTPERQWTVLDEQVDNDAICDAYQAALFALDPAAVQGVSYQYFKITQTGPNSRGNNHMLMIGGIELYGHLTGCPDKDDSDDPGRTRVLAPSYNHNTAAEPVPEGEAKGEGEGEGEGEGGREGKGEGEAKGEGVGEGKGEEGGGAEGDPDTTAGGDGAGATASKLANESRLPADLAGVEADAAAAATYARQTPRVLSSRS